MLKNMSPSGSTASQAVGSAGTGWTHNPATMARWTAAVPMTRILRARSGLIRIDAPAAAKGMVSSARMIIPNLSDR